MVIILPLKVFARVEYINNVTHLELHPINFYQTCLLHSGTLNSVPFMAEDFQTCPRCRVLPLSVDDHSQFLAVLAPWLYNRNHKSSSVKAEVSVMKFVVISQMLLIL